MKTAIRTFALASAVVFACLLASCSGSMDVAALSPAGGPASRHTGQAVSASVSGGAAAASSVIPIISNDDFKKALENSLVRSGMFKSAGSGGYQLEAFITSVEQPLMGFSMRVNMEVGYTLRRGGATVWRKSIKSTYTAPVGEAFSGAVRLRKATEGAARENISNLIRALDEAKF